MKYIFNFYGRSCEWDEDTQSFILEFRSSNDINSFYDLIRTKCYQTNFNLDPYNFNAYGKFELDNERYIIHAPTQSNSDRNWYEYGCMSKRYVEISPLDLDSFLLKKARRDTLNQIIY